MPRDTEDFVWPSGEVDTPLKTVFIEPINLMTIDMTSSPPSGALDRFSVKVVDEDGFTIVVVNKVMLKDRCKVHDVEARPSSLHSLLTIVDEYK